MGWLSRLFGLAWQEERRQDRIGYLSVWLAVVRLHSLPVHGIFFLFFWTLRRAGGGACLYYLVPVAQGELCQLSGAAESEGLDPLLHQSRQDLRRLADWAAPSTVFPLAPGFSSPLPLPFRSPFPFPFPFPIPVAVPSHFPSRSGYNGPSFRRRS